MWGNRSGYSTTSVVLSNVLTVCQLFTGNPHQTWNTWSLAFGRLFFGFPICSSTPTSLNVSFMTVVPRTSPLWDCVFYVWRILDPRETDRFLPTSGGQLVLSTFHYRHMVFSSQIKSKVGHILVKVVVLRINLKIDGVYRLYLLDHILTHHIVKPLSS